jgi:uncharacterized membrane protein
MSINVLTLVLHVLSVVIWVGGMFFAYMCLRPVAASQLEPPVRLQLWVGVFGKFFPFVWLAVILLPLTGYMMISNIYSGMGNTPLYVHLMNGLGSLMIFIYLHVFFAPYQRLKRAVAAQDWPAGGKALAQIRVLVGINMTLGLLTALIASGGRYFG